MALNAANTQDLVEVEEIVSNTVVLKGGRLVHVIMIDGVNFSLKSEQEQNIITFAYQNFLNSLDFPIQFVIHSRKINTENYLTRLDERQRNEPSSLLQNQIKEYRQFIVDFVKDNAIMQKTFFAVVVFAPTSMPSASSGAGLLSFLKKKGVAADEKAAAAKHASFEENVAQLKQRTDQVLEGLHGIGLDVVQLKDEELAELFYNFYNPETTEREGMHLIPQDADLNTPTQ